MFYLDKMQYDGWYIAYLHFAYFVYFSYLSQKSLFIQSN